MKRFTIPCDFGGQKHPFHVYIGDPNPKKHPLQFQAWWLSSERGGTIPQDVMDSFEKLFKISQENKVSFEDLCVYALGTAQKEKKSASPASVLPSEKPSSTGGNTSSAVAKGTASQPAQSQPTQIAPPEAPLPPSPHEDSQG